MSFTLSGFAKLRPYLYHVLSRDNLPVLRATATLWSAAAIAERSGDAGILKGRRDESSEVALPQGRLVVRDQRPLSKGSIRFEGGWGFEDLLHDLNRRVFLWPGTEVGPIDYGQRHAEAYKKTDVLIRMRTQDLLGSEPYFSKYNSGSPRCCGGKKSPRGPNTFLPVEQCAFTAGRVAEITFLGQLCLPADTMWRSAPDREWRLLFGA